MSGREPPANSSDPQPSRDREALRERFFALWSARGLRSPGDSVFDELDVRYQEPHRAYHTWSHIQHCLAEFDRVQEHATHRLALETAIWFHDAIYEPERKDNEEKSADWACQVLAFVGVVDDEAQRVRKWILATQHDAVPEQGDEALLVDIDLSILGAEGARFQAYEREIRSEYAWVPLHAYRVVRAGILRAFLGRPRIYLTPWFENLEGSARANLAWSIEQLER